MHMGLEFPRLEKVYYGDLPSFSVKVHGPIMIRVYQSSQSMNPTKEMSKDL